MMHLRNPDRQQAGSYTGPSASPTVNGYIAFFKGGRRLGVRVFNEQQLTVAGAYVQRLDDAAPCITRPR